MSGSFGSAKTKTNQKTSQTKNPWDVATPYIKNFLQTDVSPLIGSSQIGPSSEMSAAYDDLRGMAQQGNPYAGEIGALTSSLFGSDAATGQGYQDFKTRLTPTADGSNQSLESNPYLQQLLGMATDNARASVAEQFASAGRGFSPGHAAATSKAMMEAQLPTLANLFQYEQGRTDTAARDLFAGAGQGAAQQAQAGQAATGMGQAALDAQAWGPNQILAIEDQLRSLPVEQAAKLAAILFPAGQLGGDMTGTAKGTQKSSGFSIGGSLF